MEQLGKPKSELGNQNRRETLPTEGGTVKAR